MFVFTNMPNLTTLSINGCSSLTEDIDLTNNTEITSVDARGTTINVLIPEGSKITSYKLGTPTSVSIVNPTVLSSSNVSVTNSANITSIELTKTNGTGMFNMFGKITNTI